MSHNTDIDTFWVSRFGTVVYLNVGFLVASTFYYGVYAILVCLALPILSMKESNSKAKLGVLIPVLVMFAISTFSVGLQVANVLLSLQMVFIENNEKALDTFREKMYMPSGVEQALCFLTVLVGDSVVIWRTWVLWAGNPKIVLVPCVLLLGTAVSTFAFGGCVGHHLSSMDIFMNIPECVSSDLATYALSIATNIAATVAIGYKVWLYRKAGRRYRGTGSWQAQPERVINVVLIFGGIYCVLWIIGLIIAIPCGSASLPLRLFSYSIRGASRQATGIYPTLLIIVVHLKKSSWETHSRASENNAPDTKHIEPCSSSASMSRWGVLA